MRFLKNKIRRAQHRLGDEPPLGLLQTPSHLEIPYQNSLPDSKGSGSQSAGQPAHREGPLITFNFRNGHRQTENTSYTRHKNPMKNIAVNYGKAIANFAISPLAAPYLTDKLDQEGVTMTEFVHFVNERKKRIAGITSFRSLLLVEKRDNKKLAACKRVFQSIAIVFINYFSVNWIIHGKVSHKMTYLKFRFKMLRRIQQPEQFTFIRERAAKQ